jgi:hypothetical protein
MKRRDYIKSAGGGVLLTPLLNREHSSKLTPEQFKQRIPKTLGEHTVDIHEVSSPTVSTLIMGVYSAKPHLEIGFAEESDNQIWTHIYNLSKRHDTVRAAYNFLHKIKSNVEWESNFGDNYLHCTYKVNGHIINTKRDLTIEKEKPVIFSEGQMVTFSEPKKFNERLIEQVTTHIHD